jgi:hypothetical protein
MPEYIWPILILAGYLVLMRWVFPRLGVPT